MTPAALAAAGAAIIGHPVRWQSALARRLGVKPRTMRRYAAGHSAIPEPVARLVLVHLAKARPMNRRKG